MRIFRILITVIWVNTNYTLATPIDAGEIIDFLKLSGNNAEFIDVKKIESRVRGIPFKSAKILSVPDKDPLFFPLIVYTASKGEINTAKYDALKEEFRSTRRENRTDFGKTMGFISDGSDEIFVFLDSIKVVSNRPDIQGVVDPLTPRTVTGISIIGTLQSAELDFQIFLIGPTKAQADLFPEYKHNLESMTDFSLVGLELYQKVKNAGLIQQNAANGERPSKIPVSEITNGGERISQGETKRPSPTFESEAKKMVPKFWLWLLGSALILFVLVYAKQMKR